MPSQSAAERWEGYHRYRDVEFTFCQATGSYRRGAPLCGDIDMLTCLPPSLRDVDPQAFLKEVTGWLADWILSNTACEGRLLRKDCPNIAQASELCKPSLLAVDQIPAEQGAAASRKGTHPRLGAPGKLRHLVWALQARRLTLRSPHRPQGTCCAAAA